MLFKIRLQKNIRSLFKSVGIPLAVAFLLAETANAQTFTTWPTYISYGGERVWVSTSIEYDPTNQSVHIEAGGIYKGTNYNFIDHTFSNGETQTQANAVTITNNDGMITIQADDGSTFVTVATLPAEGYGGRTQIMIDGNAQTTWGVNHWFSSLSISVRTIWYEGPTQWKSLDIYTLTQEISILVSRTKGKYLGGMYIRDKETGETRYYELPSQEGCEALDDLIDSGDITGDSLRELKSVFDSFNCGAFIRNSVETQSLFTGRTQRL